MKEETFNTFVIIFVCVWIVSVLVLLVAITGFAIQYTNRDNFCEYMRYDGWIASNNDNIKCCKYKVPNEDRTDFVTKCKLFEYEKGGFK